MVWQVAGTSQPTHGLVLSERTPARVEGPAVERADPAERIEGIDKSQTIP